MRTRLVETDDAPALMAIYNPEVVSSLNTFDIIERTLDEQVQWIKDHQTAHQAIVCVNEEDGIGEIGARDELIIGYASVSPFRERPGYGTSVENSVYVHRDARGRGAGVLLLNELIALAGESGFHSLLGRITGENLGSIRLHEKCGFTLVGTEIEVGRKHGKWLDVVEYQYVIRSS